MPGGTRGFRDKFNLLTFDLYANKPETGDREQLFICTDVDGQPNAGKIYRGTGTGWVLLPVAAHTHSIYSLIGHTHAYAALVHAHDYAATNHNHDGRYSLIDHTHPEHLGLVTVGDLALEQLKGEAAPTGALAWSRRVNRIVIAGTEVHVVGFYAECDADGKPASDITLDLNLDGVEIAQVTVLSGQSSGSTVIADVELTADGQLFTVDFPVDMAGSLGWHVYIILERHAV